jgi:hypothetical protein
MRTLSLALIASLALAGSAAAVTKKKLKDQSPPTAKADSTLVAPDITPPPPTIAAPTRPVEAVPIGTTGVASAPPPAAPVAAPAAPAQPAPPPVPVLSRAGECLRTEAPRAAKAETSIKLAVDLLLEDLCGAVVERAALYTHNAEALARFTPQSERAAAGLNGARVDPETGEIVNPPASDVAGALGAGGFNPADLTPPAPLRRYAAELVLAARALPQPPPTAPASPKKAH